MDTLPEAAKSRKGDVRDSPGHAVNGRAVNGRAVNGDAFNEQDLDAPRPSMSRIEYCRKRQFERTTSKHVDGVDHAGRRDHWRNINPRSSDELAVAGYMQPKGRRSGFGAALVATAIDQESHPRGQERG